MNACFEVGLLPFPQEWELVHTAAERKKAVLSFNCQYLFAVLDFFLQHYV